MRKILILLAMVAITAKAQTVEKYEFYCYALHASDDRGCLMMPGQEEYLDIVDENGDAIKFKNGLDLMLYLSKRGWVYVETYTERALGIAVHPFLMKKVVTDDAQAMENLRLEKRSFGKKKKKE